MLSRSMNKTMLASMRTIIRKGSDHAHHHTPPMPPFARLRPPTSHIPEEVELVWDDSVAPEVALDFDAPQIGLKKVLKSFFLAFSFVGSVMGFCIWNEPEKKRPVVGRLEALPYGGFREELGLAKE